MSTSALIAAKKRFETSLKKFEIPTTTDKAEEWVPQSGVLLLSLLQSRLNWTSSIFPKYKADAIQQPKRHSNTRKKWPNMTFLGVGTLELGAHMFDNTQFFQAKRTIPFPVKDGQEEDIKVEEFVDIVFELTEVPNERFVFPKEAMISLFVEDGPIVIHGSFLLPLDATDEFELGKKRSHDELLEDAKSKIESLTYQPTHVRISKLDQVAIDALEDYVMSKDKVEEIIRVKMSKPVQKSFLKYNLTEDTANAAEVQDLLKRATTLPDITTGPIMAEKKRNEILNAIQLGKRPRDEKFEAELPKHKYANNASKEDGLLKCAYCSTKHTAMWRPGPGGHGTLCNSCGLQWKRGEILKGAIVISAQEERRLIKERKEKERAQEEAELERAEREQHKKVQKTVVEAPHLMKKTPSTSNSASNKLNRSTNIPKAASTSATPEPTANTATPMDIDPADNKSTTISTASQQQQQQQTDRPATTSSNGTTANTQQQQQQGTSFHLYSQGGIPLPTLSIDLGESLLFSHPNCAVTLLDGHFHIRLSTGTAEQSFINLEKSDLTDAQFNITNEGDASLSREVLTMTLSPLNRSVQLLSKTIDEKHAIKVRFLEKLDPSGGAVVKRIIQRWLVTIPQ